MAWSAWIVGLIGTALLLVSQGADARFIRVDQSSDNATINGENWSSFSPLNVESGGPVSVNVGFDLEYAPGTSVSQIDVFEDGRVQFASGSFIDVFAPLSGSIVSTFTPEPPPDFGSLNSEGQVSRTSGELDRSDPFGDSYEDAVRVHWSDVAISGGTDLYSFQAIFIDLGNGDFDLELNYVLDGGAVTEYAAGIALQQIVIDGQQLVATAGPFSGRVNYDFAFRDGQLAAAAVDEPGTLALLLTGLLAALYRRKKAA